MDKARSFEYVQRLPANDLDQLSYREAVYDRQVLLNESWNTYARRSHQYERMEENHVKWITETWDEYELRKLAQRKVLMTADMFGEKEIAARVEKERQKEDKSQNTIMHLMSIQGGRAAERIQCRHNLFVDFDQLQHLKFIEEQKIVFSAECMMRLYCDEAEAGIRGILEIWGECHRISSLMAMSDRLKIEEEERQRIAEEERRIIEEARIREEMRQKELEEAEIRRKEALEQAKIIERKRRDEERRAKARAEREKLKHNHNVQEITATEECSAKHPSPDATLVSLFNAETVEPVVKPESNRKRIMYSKPVGASVHDLIKNASSLVGDAGDVCYVMRIDKAAMTSTVVCQNGFYASSKDTLSHLIGLSVSRNDAISISSDRLHGPAASSLEEYKSSRIEFVSNSRTDQRCFLFNESMEKKDETVVFLPLSLLGLNYSPFVFAVCRDAALSFNEDEVNNAVRIVWEVSKLIELQIRNEHRCQLCRQCVEWLTAVTGCENCYVSLREEEDENTLTYVAASPSHQFMLGKRHTAEEEHTGSGISFKACELAEENGLSTVFTFDNIENCHPFVNQRVRTFLDGEKTGSLLAGTITGKKSEKNSSVGMIFLDAIGTKKEFTEGEKDILKIAAQTLANLLLGNIPETLANTRLKIEDVFPNNSQSPITFLKCVWVNALEDLQRITPGQLLELAKYLHPPPIIPVVVQGTLIVALGSTPSKVEKWEDARSKVTNKLLTKMSLFDPTDTKRRKKKFFLRAGKLLKNYTVNSILEKGSYPASCFFSWTFAAILLRRRTDALLKKNQTDAVDLSFTDQCSLPTTAEEQDNSDDDDNDSGNESDEV